jgi:hypothetical protein
MHDHIMDYLKKTRYQHGYCCAHVVPKNVIVSLDLNLTYYASLATHTITLHQKPLHQSSPYNL